MKKIVFLLFAMLSFPLWMVGQQVEDDLYFVPSKDKQAKKEASAKSQTPKRVTTTRVYSSPGVTTVVVKDRKGNARDVDEYNRRYSSRENEFSMENDTLFIEEKSRPDLDGEWVNGDFRGTQDDYEYAERIIRFRNPRFAVSISSPLYWDIVYGANSFDWNVYTDGLYAYAFPTNTNRLWWNWRYNYSGWGWNRPYYSGWGYYPGYWDSWYAGGYWGGWYGGSHWGHNHWYHSDWGWGGSYYGRGRDMLYTNRRSPSRDTYRVGERTGSRYVAADRYQSNRTGSANRTSSRVIGTRTSERTGYSVRSGANSSRTNVYTRPSSTRSTYDSTRGTSSGRYGVNDRTGSSSFSTTPVRSSNRSYSTGGSRRSYNSSSSSSRSGRSYSSGSSSSGSNRTSSGGGSSSRGGSARGSSRR